MYLRSSERKDYFMYNGISNFRRENQCRLLINSVDQLLF